jgi:hypothetical protein
MTLMSTPFALSSVEKICRKGVPAEVLGDVGRDRSGADAALQDHVGRVRALAFHSRTPEAGAVETARSQ